MGFSITGKELWIIMVLPQLLLREQIEKKYIQHVELLSCVLYYILYPDIL